MILPSVTTRVHLVPFCENTFTHLIKRRYIFFECIEDVTAQARRIISNKKASVEISVSQ